MLHTLLRDIEGCLRQRRGAASHGRLAAVSYIHHFGAAFNRNVHVHYYVIDLVFEPATAARKFNVRFVGLTRHSCTRGQ